MGHSIFNMHKECYLGTAALIAAGYYAYSFFVTRAAKPKQIPKVYYWPARGRGQQVRLVLAEAGVEFEDVSFDMTKEESKLSFFANCKKIGGHLTTNIPMVDIDGKILTQSSAVMKYLGRRFSLYPSNLDDAYTVDMLLATAEDLRSANYKPMKMFGGSEADKQHYKTDVLPVHLSNYERLLGDKDYFTGRTLTVADLSLYDTLHVVECQVPGTLREYPKLKSFFDRVQARPTLAKFLGSKQCEKLFCFPQL
mmetsp:Transcript_4415/g.5114  ORF Transcript_4415/g.5114 Transcript_4415/m.5114 type:complete len:252 (-) Transcript_4415:83-838(-)|eukprot:CAMPEP_0197845422 /NCGR_PEP_ID=MMETSP1438-20131217/2360_1 /TAXON_ID=1461541 /ORGANISM="Pterosperma sp., Strain CCMP1384" /LENGTH=251 /DNA_ID=CAMNT_0043456711 /DNA_START=123 /DNA_END=878 /DNA_ORIENTATION=-